MEEPKVEVKSETAPETKSGKDQLLWKALKERIMRERAQKQKDLEEDAERFNIMQERNREIRENLDELDENERKMKKSVVQEKLTRMLHHAKKLLREKKITFSAEQMAKFREAFDGVIPSELLSVPPNSCRESNVRKRDRSPSPPQIYRPAYAFKEVADPLSRSDVDSRDGHGYFWNRPPPSGYYFPGHGFSVPPTVYHVPVTKPPPDIDGQKETQKDHPIHGKGSHGVTPSVHLPAYLLDQHGKPVLPDEKLFFIPSHMSVQQPPPQGTKMGSITSGYPLRSAASSSQFQQSPHIPQQSTHQSHQKQHVQVSSQQPYRHVSISQVQPPVLPSAQYHHSQMSHHTQQPSQVHAQQQQSHGQQSHVVIPSPQHSYYHQQKQSSQMHVPQPRGGTPQIPASESHQLPSSHSQSGQYPRHLHYIPVYNPSQPPPHMQHMPTQQPHVISTHQQSHQMPSTYSQQQYSKHPYGVQQLHVHSQQQPQQSMHSHSMQKLLPQQGQSSSQQSDAKSYHQRQHSYSHQNVQFQPVSTPSVIRNYPLP